MIKRAFRIPIITLLIVALLISLSIVLLTTPAGLWLTVDIANYFLPGKLSLTDVHGNLLHGFKSQRVTYQDQNGLRITLKQWSATWKITTQPKLKLNYQLQFQIDKIPGAWRAQGHLHPLAPYFIKTDVVWQSSQTWIGNAHLHLAGNRQDLQAKLTANLTHPTRSDLTIKAHWAQQQFKAMSQMIIEGKKLILDVFYNTHKKPAFLAVLNSEAIELTTQDKTIKINPINAKIQGNSLQDMQGHLPLRIIYPGYDLQADILYQTANWNNQTTDDYLRLSGRYPHLQLNGVVKINQQPVLLNGKGNFSPAISGNVDIKANNLVLVHDDEYHLSVSPQLSLQVSKGKISLDGEIIIPEAKIAPISFNNTLNMSEDVIYVDENKQSGPTPLAANVKLIMGKSVFISIKGLEGYLAGAININKAPGGTATASGELNISDGHYNLYGQQLQITKGQLLFGGGLIDNPGVAVTAIRQFKTNTQFTNATQIFNINTPMNAGLSANGMTTVGVHVNGRIKTPKIELFSIPANISQADILSLLILGKPVAQANEAGGQILMSALSSLNLGGGSKGKQLLSQLEKSLGISVSLTNNAVYNPQTNQISDAQGLQVSKNLSKKLQMNYNVGLTQGTSNVLTIKYLLNKFFSVQISTSTAANGADVMYTQQK